MGNCPYESELVLAIKTRKGSIRKSEHTGRVEIRNTLGADWMVDEVHTSIWIGHFVRLFFLCVIEEASKVKHSASYVVGCWRLLAAVFVSAASTPHLGAFEAGVTL